MISRRFKMSLFSEKAPIFPPFYQELIYEVRYDVGEERRYGHRILRIREEEEQGDQEPEADQAQEWKSCDQGHLRFLRKANIQNWKARKVTALSLPLYFEGRRRT